MLFQISQPGPGLYGERLAVALGFVTLVFALATFASCRSCLSFLGRIGVKLRPESGGYQGFYRYHGYYWAGFIFTLVLHTMSAIMHTAIPKAGDPDAGIHWLILSFALGSLVFTGGVLSSCRSLVSLINMFAENGPMSNAVFRGFFRLHSYSWLILIMAIAGHFAAANVHVGFWPK